MTLATKLSKNRKTIGFTLLETAMSLYILLVGVLCFSGMAVFANKVGLQSQMRTGAINLASSQLEVLKSTSFDNLTAASETNFGIPDSFISQLPTGTNQKYQFEGAYSVTAVNTTKKKIDVRIRWRNASAPEGNVTRPWSQVRLSTLLTKPGSVTTP